MKTIRVLLLVAMAWLALPASVSAFYNPEEGRWLNRDPIQEKDLPNLYAFVGNNPVIGVDRLGLEGGGFVLCPGCNRNFWLGDFQPFECPYCGWGKPKPPTPPADNPCDGYKKFIPTPKCTCNCKLVSDPYPANAEKVCNGFMEKYEWSEKAQCVARCLVAAENGAYKLKWCSIRATIRLSSHVACYAGCGFFPWEGLPPGGVSVCAGDLLGTLVKCRDPWNEAK